MTKNVTVNATLTHTKSRNMFGLIIVSCNNEKRRIRIRYAKEWGRDALSDIPSELNTIYKKVKWDSLHIDQLTGQHLIDSIKKKGMSVKIITTQKDLKNPEGIEDLEVMDKNEAISLFIKFRQQKKIEFHPNPTGALILLEEQMPLYIEHITEAGSVDYYAPGNEYDHLTRGLLMMVFVLRYILEDMSSVFHVGGAVKKKPLPFAYSRVKLDTRGMSLSDYR